MDAKQDGKEVGAKEKGRDLAKQAYTEPKLTLHGKVEDITRNLGGPAPVDAPYGSSM
jgi:hypothetical protein